MGFITNKSSAIKTDSGIATIDVSLEPIDIIVTETEIILNPIYFEYNKSENN
jgi:hypothetical protein